MVEQGTLYPFHRPFLAPEIHAEVESSLILGVGLGIKTLMGRVANGFGANPALKYCTECLADQIISVGYTYWCRQHQIPGVAVCFKHGCTLSTDGRKRAIGEFLNPPRCPPQRKSHRSANSETQYNFAALSSELVLANLQPMKPSDRVAVYAEEAMRLGFVTRNGNVDKSALAASLRHYYDDFMSFSFRDRLLSSASLPVAWLHSMFNRPAKSLHPICHLLMIGYLFGSVRSFADRIAHIAASTEIAHLGIPLEQDLKANEGIELKALHDLTHSCRQVAKRLNVSVTTVVTYRRSRGLPVSSRRKHVSVSLIEDIKSALRSGVNPSLVAESLMTSVSTVYRVRSEIKTELDTSAKHELAKAEDRARFVALFQANLNAGITEIRSIDRALYARLYRNDRTWMKSNTRRSKVTCGKRRVDWASRDSAFCEVLDHFVLGFLRTPKRAQLTYTLMLSQLPSSMVRENLEKLPRLNILLQAYVETLSSYQRLRIRNVIKEYRCSGILPAQSTIQRRAGIKNWTPELNGYLLRQLFPIRSSDI